MITLKLSGSRFKIISIIKKIDIKAIKQYLEYKGSLSVCKERMYRKDKCPHIKNMLKNPQKTHGNSEKVLAFRENLCYSITS